MTKRLYLEIISRETAERLANILGPSCAAAAALRNLDSMGDDAKDFEICRNVKANSLVLMDKKFLTDPRLSVTNGDRK
jgi:predicted nuclease of predicted toxin-antitoxin system